MKKYLTLLSAAVVSMIVLVSYKTTAAEGNRDCVEAGTKLIDAGKYRLALKALKGCDIPFAYALRMEAYYGLGRPRSAIRYGTEYLDRISVSDPNLSYSSYILENVYGIFDSDWKYAVKILDKHLSEKGMRPQTAIILGKLYYTHECYIEAIEQFKAVDVYYQDKIGWRDDWICRQVGASYYKMHDYENAIEHMSEYLNGARLYDISVIHDRALYYMAAGKYSEALADYEHASQMDPSMAETYFGKCAVLYKQGRLEEARTEYERGIKEDPTKECLEYNMLLKQIVTEFSECI